jgi:hypothetical protein
VEAWPGLYIAQREGYEQEGRPGDGFGRSRGENGDDVVFSTAAGGLARMGVRGAAWREAKAPAEAAQEAVELHAQCMEAAERHGEAKPGRLSSPELQIRGGGGRQHRGEERRCHRRGNGSRRGRGGSPAQQLAAWGSRWAGGMAAKGGGGALCFSEAQG